MAINAAELQVVIGADTSPAVSGIRGAMGMIGHTASTALGVFTGQVLFGALKQVGQGIVSLGAEALQSTTSWEQLGFSIQSLVANELKANNSTLSMADALRAAANPAEETLKWIQNLAIVSPFPTETVAQVFQMQMRMGATREEAKVLSKALLDIGAATGLTGESLNSAGLALSQIGSSSKLSAQDLRQLINAGIPVNEILKKMGLQWEDIGKKAVSGRDFIQAFIDEAGNFSGSIDRMQGSWTAMAGALADVKAVGLRELFGGIFEALKPVVQKFTDWLLGPGLEKLREIGENLGKITSKIVEIGQAFASAGPFSEQFSNALSSLSPSLGELWAKIAPFIQQGLAWISEHRAEVIAALTGMAVAFGALTVIGVVAGLITALANPIILIIGVVGLLAAAWTGNWGGIQEKTRAALAFISEKTQLSRTFLQNSWNGLVNFIRGAWDGLMRFIIDLTSGKLGWLSTIWTTTAGYIQTTVQNATTIIKAIFAAFHAALSGDWYAFGQRLRIVWDTVWEQIKTAVRSAWTVITTIFSTAIQAIITHFRATDWGSVGRGIVDGIANGIKNAAEAIANAAVAAAKAAISAVKGYLGIKSPSKIFEREIAGNMMAGWVRGIERMTPRFEVAVANASGRAMAASATNYYNLTVQSVRSAEQIERDFWLMRG